MSFIEALNAKRVSLCPLCASASPAKMWSKGGFDYMRCADCRAVFVNPQLQDDALERIHMEGHPHKKKQDILRSTYQSHRSALLKKMKAYYKTGRLLDVGCGQGYFIANASRKGWESVGLDVSGQDAAFAKEILNQHALRSDLMSAAFPDDHFDVVTLFDTLEHIREPALFLKEVCRIIRPGGLLYIETPHFNALPKRVWQKRWSVFFPWHFYYFTKETLQNLLEKTGFVTRSTITWGLTPLGCKDAVKSLEKNTAPSEKGEWNLLLATALVALYNFLRSLERTLFIVLEKCNISIGTKIEAWAEKPS